MAKYLIEIPDEQGQAYNIAPYIYEENVMWMDGYEKGVEAGRDDAWKFVMKCLKMDGNDFYEIFNSCDALCLTNLSYQEAKVKYDAWKKKKDEIQIGDEVIYNSRTRAVVLEPETEKRYGEIFTSEGSTIVVSHNDLKKTGKHFDEVAELLKKMRESDED